MQTHLSSDPGSMAVDVLDDKREKAAVYNVHKRLLACEAMLNDTGDQSKTTQLHQQPSQTQSNSGSPLLHVVCFTNAQTHHPNQLLKQLMASA
jgi:hypothetical protein